MFFFMPPTYAICYPILAIVSVPPGAPQGLSTISPHVRV